MLLERMRQGTAKVVGSALAALLIVAFAAWGIDDFLRPQVGNEKVATVGDQPISTYEFDREFRNALNRLRRTLGDEVDIQRARELGIADGTLDGMVDRRLLSVAAHGMGLALGDDVIQSRIRSERAFQGPGGRFDLSLFQQTLAQSSLSEAQYVAMLRDEMSRGYLVRAIAAGSQAPPDLTKSLHRYRDQKRTGEIVVVKRSAFADVGKATDAQLVDYHKANAAAFTAPEYREITAILLRPADFAAGLEPSEEQIKAEYENRLPSLTIPERRKLEQILFTDEAKARKAAGLLKEGRNFESVAKEVANRKKEELELGFMTKSELAALSSQLADATFALQEGQTTDAIASPLGWHIVRVATIRPGTTPKLADVRAGIAKDISLEKAAEHLTDIANKVEDSLAGGASIEEAASQAGVAALDLPPIDRSGLGQDGKKAKELPATPVLLRTAFTTGVGEVSRMEETPDGGFLILRVDKVIAPALRPLDQVREKVAKAWQRARQDEAAEKRAIEIRDKVKAGAKMADAAAEFKLTASTGPAVTRRGDPEGKFPRPLIGELFSLDVGGVATGPMADGFAVIRLTKVENPNGGTDDKGLEAFRSEIAAEVGQDLMAQFSEALKSRYPVSRDKGALNRYLDRLAGPDTDG